MAWPTKEKSETHREHADCAATDVALSALAQAATLMRSGLFERTALARRWLFSQFDDGRIDERATAYAHGQAARCGQSGAGWDGHWADSGGSTIFAMVGSERHRRLAGTTWLGVPAREGGHT